MMQFSSVLLLSAAQRAGRFHLNPGNDDMEVTGHTKAGKQSVGSGLLKEGKRGERVVERERDDDDDDDVSKTKAWQ